MQRKTFEETGIRLDGVVYHSSQPRPFPYSLMIGCYGEAFNEDISTDADELKDYRWFSRAEVLQMLAGTHPRELRVPPGHGYRPSAYLHLGRRRLTPGTTLSSFLSTSIHAFHELGSTSFTLLAPG